MERVLPRRLLNSQSFSKREFVSAMAEEYGMTVPQIAYDLQKRQDNGNVIHLAWNKYTILREKGVYSYQYSEMAEDIVSKVDDSFIDLNYRVFELIQLNEFINHQIAHNTVFVSVENELQDFVFDMLKREYPGQVMLRPSLKDYYRYLTDNEIVLLRLPSESPKGIKSPWHSRLEKIIVDVFTDKLIGGIVPEGEKQAIYRGAFDKYLLDEKTMIRYAKRKGAAEKLEKEMKKYEVDAI